MINEKVVSILKDKINVVKNDDHFIYIVGPITLPVNLDGETQV
ncbi:GTP cyclohydrolase II, partial [Priestia megaterium]